jgi:mediator of RNA polymerase II transcription subunit 8
MGMLLRKKLEPPIESWTDEGRSIGADAATGGSHDEELWAWAIEWMGTRVVTYAEKEEGKNYTADERKKGIENVNTGLRRKLEDDYSDEGDEEEDEDEDEEMEDVGVTVTSVRRMSSGQVDFGMGEVKHSEAGKGPNARSVEEILRFATSGAVVGGQR